MNETPATHEFTPQPTPRSAESTLWILSLAASGAWLWMLARASAFAAMLGTLFGVLTFLGVGLALNAWMEQRTRLQLTPDGVTYTNGLRRVTFGWQEIEQIVVQVMRNGRILSIHSPQTHIQFRIETTGGFAEGQRILSLLLQHSHLQRQPEQTSGVTYYSRG
ncbi:MAG: hypothetical protein OHK0052_10050 [Anaerolineales bacterium]